MKRSTNAFRTLVTMIKTEGPLSIYKGLTGSLLREASYSCVSISLFPFFPASSISTPCGCLLWDCADLTNLQRYPDGRLRPRQVLTRQILPPRRSKRLRYEAGSRNGQRNDWSRYSEPCGPRTSSAPASFIR